MGDDCVATGRDGDKSGQGVCAPFCSDSGGCESGYICTSIGELPSGESTFVCNGSALAARPLPPGAGERSGG